MMHVMMPAGFFDIGKDLPFGFRVTGIYFLIKAQRFHQVNDQKLTRAKFYFSFDHAFQFKSSFSAKNSQFKITLP
jgi:hypothetical protein